ncbi:MAG: efflux RND transporter permease subunit, partial [Desulfomonilaceae bacterium]
FEPSDIVSQVMSLGSTTPIEIASYGPDIDADVEFAKRIKEKMATIKDLRDIHFGQVLDYPTLDVNFDRERSGIIGANMYNAMKSLVPAVWNSRYTFPLYWGDPHSDCTYEIQVQTPQEDIRSIETILNTQVNYGSMENRKASLFRNLADFKRNEAFEEYAHLDNQRLVTVNANLAPGAHLGSVSREVEKMIEQMGAPPPRVAALIRGQAVLLNEMMEGLQKGSIFALFLMLIILCVALQSVRLTLSCLSIVPAAICGIVIALKLTNTAINIQSFSGAVVSIGLVITNSILFVIFAERSRVLGWRTRFISENQAGIKNGESATLTPPEELISDGPSASTAVEAALAGAGNRLRPVLMTSLAMIFGMAPMALGWGEGGKQTAPLGLALVAGLVMATPAILLLLPPFFAIIQESSHGHSASLDPYHPESSDYISGGSD